MRKLFCLLLLVSSISAVAQSSTGPAISNAGATLQNFPVSLEVNFTFASPYGAMVYADGANTELITGIPAQNVAIILGEPSTVGLEEIENSDLSTIEIFFNPLTSQILFRGEEIENFAGDLLVFDLQGKILFKSDTANGSPVTIHVASSQNLFIVSLVQENRIVVSRKFISQP